MGNNASQRIETESEEMTMKAQLIFALTFAMMAGFAGRADASDCGVPQIRGTSTFIGVSVPLFFYTSPDYSTSIYGSPGNSPGYYGTRACASTGSRYQRYQANPWYADKRYVRCVVTANASLAAGVQSALAHRGYYRGAIDGIIGPMSLHAIRQFQASRGLAPTGVVDYPLLRALDVR